MSQLQKQNKQKRFKINQHKIGQILTNELVFKKK